MNIYDVTWGKKGFLRVAADYVEYDKEVVSFFIKEPPHTKIMNSLNPMVTTVKMGVECKSK